MFDNPCGIDVRCSVHMTSQALHLFAFILQPDRLMQLPIIYNYCILFFYMFSIKYKLMSNYILSRILLITNTDVEEMIRLM